MFISDPGDSRPALLIGGSDRIVVTHLNGSGLQPLRSLRINGTLALDFQQNQESVCWVLSSESSGQLRCAVTRSLRGFTREQEIRTQQSLQRMFISVPSFVHFSDKQPSNHTNKRYSCLWRASSGAHASLFSHCTLLSLSLLPASSLALSPHYHRGLRQVSLSSFGIHLYPAIAIQACELHSLHSLHSLRCFRSATFFCSSKDSHEL